MTSTRDQLSCRNLLDTIKRSVPIAQGLLLTAFPSGGLQLIQPAAAPEPAIRFYSQGGDSVDLLSWRAIAGNRMIRLADVVKATPADAALLQRDLLTPMEWTHAAAFPLTAPALEGFAGAALLFRHDREGDFRRSELDEIRQIIGDFETRLSASRARRPGRAASGVDNPLLRPTAHVAVLDAQQRPVYCDAPWSSIDSGIRRQFVEQARDKMLSLNGDETRGDRQILTDSHGDVWAYRLVIHRRFPALGNGAHAVFCVQPNCAQWSGLRAADVHADTELARLIPSLRFLQDNFRRGPGLEDIAKTAHLSQFHFHRRFTDLLGLTPKQFMSDCQIHQAKLDLMAGQKELIDVARACGFAHQSHFTSRFKQSTGLTPTRWRRMARKRMAAMTGDRSISAHSFQNQ